MRRDIEFPSGGSLCRGWLYGPDAPAGMQSAPAIVMAHGFSAVKEMFQLSSYAERFEAAGFIVLVYLLDLVPAAAIIKEATTMNIAVTSPAVEKFRVSAFQPTMNGATRRAT